MVSTIFDTLSDLFSMATSRSDIIRRRVSSVGGSERKKISISTHASQCFLLHAMAKKISNRVRATFFSI